ncbi:creatininase family protein [Deinococcus marmoris]|uniref:creatininase family protein n=1 Tax=Deinococcus marmoris TaxID=249408 RepID=UPI0020C9B67E|nr:creatininase family protein [Deinococcus marmoris]
MVRDVVDGLHEQGFRRILIINGHGGNTPAQGFAAEWMADHPGTQVKFHNWWNAPGSGPRCRPPTATRPGRSSLRHTSGRGSPLMPVPEDHGPASTEVAHPG